MAMSCCASVSTRRRFRTGAPPMASPPAATAARNSWPPRCSTDTAIRHRQPSSPRNRARRPALSGMDTEDHSTVPIVPLAQAFDLAWERFIAWAGPEADTADNRKRLAHRIVELSRLTNVEPEDMTQDL